MKNSIFTAASLIFLFSFFALAVGIENSKFVGKKFETLFVSILKSTEAKK